jgi:hypothetical protein
MAHRLAVDGDHARPVGREADAEALRVVGEPPTTWRPCASSRMWRR